MSLQYTLKRTKKLKKKYHKIKCFVIYTLYIYKKYFNYLIKLNQLKIRWWDAITNNVTLTVSDTMVQPLMTGRLYIFTATVISVVLNEMNEMLCHL